MRVSPLPRLDRESSSQLLPSYQVVAIFSVLEAIVSITGNKNVHDGASVFELYLL